MKSTSNSDAATIALMKLARHLLEHRATEGGTKGALYLTLADGSLWKEIVDAIGGRRNLEKEVAQGSPAKMALHRLANVLAEDARLGGYLSVGVIELSGESDSDWQVALRILGGEAVVMAEQGEIKVIEEPVERAA